MSALKNERALKKGKLTRIRRRAFVLVDTVGSKRELHSVIKELDDALEEVLEVNMKYSLTLEDEEQKKRCEDYESEVVEEHRIAVERIEAHLKERAGEAPSEASVKSSAASRASAQHATRMAVVEDTVRELELEQLRNRLKKEEEEQRLQRERRLEEKEDALRAAKLKTELTRAAESDLDWDRREDFVTGSKSEDIIQEVKKKNGQVKVMTPQEEDEASGKVFRQSLPRLKLPNFSGAVEEWPRWRSLFSALVDKQDMSADEKMVHLQSAVTGPARATIGGMVCDGSSYEEALQALHERYGRDVDVVQSTLKTVFSCPAPKQYDARSLERYYGAVHGATVTLKKMGYEGDLQSCENLRRLVGKLPMEMRKTWSEHVLEIDRPTLVDFDEWLRKQVRVILSCEALTPPSGQQRRTVSTFATTASTTASADRVCVLCSKNHGLWVCEQFRSKTVDDRAQVVAGNHLCFSCLRPGHRSRSCRAARVCGIDRCTLRHNRLLHGSKRVRRLVSASTLTTEATGNVINEVTVASVRQDDGDCSSVLLQVVPVRIHGRDGGYRDTLALLDPGAQTSLCCRSVLDVLQIEGEAQPLRLNNVEAPGRERLSRRVQLEISPLAETEETAKVICVPEAFSVEKLNVRTPVLAGRKLSTMKHLHGLGLPDLSVGVVELLLGANVVEAVLQREARVGSPGEPVAIRTAFGWALTGSLTSLVPEHVREVMFVGSTPGEQAHLDLSDWWSTEAFGSCPSPSTLTGEDQRAMNILEKTTQLKEGKYEVGLIWKDEEVSMPDNYVMASSRLRSLESSLRKNPEKASAYSEALESYVQQGYARKLTAQEREAEEKKRWVLPHHAVSHPEKPKPRVVFDAAAQFEGTSLNSELLKGPDLLQHLHGVLLRFRQERYALVADIYQMFHQIRMRPQDQPALSFLWRGLEAAKPPELYQMLVVIFGSKCSPCIANYVLRRTLTEDSEAEEREEVPTLFASFYVDDFLRAETTVESAVKTMKKVSSLLSRGGFRLTKWKSNHPELLEHIPEEDRDPSQKRLVPCEGGVGKALGCVWCPADDTLSIQVRASDGTATKRSVVSLAASLFDPLGLISPFILQVKILIQKLWLLKLDWDDLLSGTELSLWRSWLGELQEVSNIKIPRCLKMKAGSVQSMQLHLFSDASEKAFAAVCYVRMTDSAGHHTTSLVMSRTRVAPLKQLSIVRLELQGAVLATRLAKTVQKEMTYQFDDIVFWSDSQVVLQFVVNESRMFQTFVANRVSEIRDSTSPSQWRYVPGPQNPADIGSRGRSASHLKDSSLWWKGPDFLREGSSSWPHLNVPSVTPDVPELRKTERPVVGFVGGTGESEPLVDPARFSSWTKYKRVVAWILRFVQNARRKGEERGPLTVEELRQAEIMIIREDQRKNERTPPPGLSLFEDECGLLRVTGRLSNAPAGICREPVALSPRSELTRLIVTDLHECCMHAGLNHTLNLLREKYWLPKARATVKKLIWRCVRCRIRRATPVCPKMADLPRERFDTSRPFSSVGLDFLGPIDVRKFRKTEKRYILLVTCLTTRAIHLEVAESLSTDSFLMALRRFIARRGKPALIWSDNGTNLVGGERELREAIAEWNQEKICDALSQRAIQWKFNPPTASHMGGAWERLVASVKKALRVVLGKQTVPDDVLHTTVLEVEYQVNSRPLTYVSGHGGDPEALTPNHFLMGVVPEGSVLPPGVFEGEETSRKRWRQSQALADQVWRRWLKEYVPTLIARKKWCSDARNVEVGDVVLLVEDTPRGYWPLGVVKEVTRGGDGVVRSAVVRTSSGTYRRPSTKICHLEGRTS